MERVDGVMDPFEGRFVIHGHLSEGRTAVSGGLPPAAVEGVLEAAILQFTAEFETRLSPSRGPLSLNLTIATTGDVTACDVLIDRELHPEIDDTAWEPIRETFLERLQALRFPSASEDSVVVLPVMFGARPRNGT